LSYFSTDPPLPGLLRPLGMILYVLIGLALASFVIAFFSARTWHWGYVIVVELIFLSTIGFFLLASETVRINAIYRTKINGDQDKLDTFEAQNNALVDGVTATTKETKKTVDQLSGQDPPVKMVKDEQGNDKIDSIADLDHELLIATRLRGRIWRNVKPAGAPNAQTGAVNVAVPSPTPAGIKPQTVVFLFEDGPTQPPAANGTPQGAQYLGEFTVASAGPQQAALQPVLPLDEFQRRRLAGSRATWIIYETMPLDRHEIFAKKTDKELQQLLPKKTVNEYIRDGKPATADDDPLRVVGFDENNKPLPPGDLSKATKKLYQRRLRDYAAEFDELSRRRIAMLTDKDALNKDIARLKLAEDAAKKIQSFRQDERTKLTSDLAGFVKEKAAIEKHLADVNKLLARARQLTAELIKRNDQLAAELAARQLQAPKPAGGGSATPAKSAAPLALGK
jgi:hypothetical protein